MGYAGMLGLGFEFILHAWLNGLREAMQEFLGAYFLFAIYVCNIDFPPNFYLYLDNKMI